MALALTDPVLAKQRFFRSVALMGSAAGAGLQGLAYAFFSYLMQQGSQPNLEVVEFGPLTDTETVVCSEACKLRALALLKTTATATFSKATDSATTSSDAASEIRVWQSGALTAAGLFYPKGQAFANGITMQGNTTANGGGASGSDGASGVALLSAA